MIYLFGMSHILPILQACSPSKKYFSEIANDNEPAFIDWPTVPGSFSAPVKAANLFIDYRTKHWGPVLAQRNENVLSIAPGFLTLLNSIDTQPSDNVLFASINGVETLSISIAQHEVPFDFHLPWRPDLPLLPGHQVVPLETVSRQMVAELDETIAVLTAIRHALPRLRVVWIASPPVMSDAQCRQYPSFMDRNFPATPIHPPSIRAKYYLLYLHIMERVLASLNIEMLLPPVRAFGPDGTMNDDYAGDIIHGNGAYGALVVAQMDAMLHQGAR